MRILVTGGSGFIGTALVPRLLSLGHEVVVLTRKSSRVAPGIAVASWDPATGKFQRDVLAGVDAVVHLAGAGIADKRWTNSRRAAILNSRVDSTRLLVSAMQEAGTPPQVFVSASAIGFYGDTGDDVHDETSGSGDGFAAEVCRAWEASATVRGPAGAAEAASAAASTAEAASATAAGVPTRTAFLRFGTVLDPAGGALARMLPLFRLGLGGRLGSGRQWMSCISREDAIAAIVEALGNEALNGPVNVVAPDPIRNADFTRALASGLGKRVGPPVPGLALRAVYGRMAKELLLGSSRVVPRVLTEAGFEFRHPDIVAYLEQLHSGRQ
ncbi:MAG: DUF1731 domain-containing protein [Spirochaetaceae bacterium]|nr:MAG: DUF1731 domain-containing protein [Spirochaetaceae bacterium]